MQLTEIFSNSLKLMIDKFVIGIPNLIMAAVVCGIGVFIAKSVSKIIKLFLSNLGIDKLGEKLNEIEFVYKMGLTIKISEILSKIIYYMLLLLFIVVSTDILQMPALSDLVSSAIEFIPNLVVAIVLLIVGLLGADALRKTVQTTCTSLGIPSAKIISIFVFYFVFITIFIMALSQAKINTAFLAQNISIIIGGAVFAFSLGYGLASKEVVANFLASMYSQDRVKVGDVVRFNGIEGKISDVDKSAITISTETSKIVVPMHKLMSENIEILN
jgi:hypothetical protein